MKNLKRALLTAILISPLTALAHGEEVLFTLFIQLGLIIIFGLVLWTIKLNLKGKLILGTIFILTTLLTFKLVDNLPYNEYETIINVVIIVVPLTIVSISYMGLKTRFQKK